MKASLTVLALTPLALAFPSLGQNLLVNGNFESEPNWGSSAIYYDGSATALTGSQIPGWTIAPGHAATVHVSPGAYPVIDGQYSVNTDGEGYNGNNADLYQNFSTQSGKSYDLSFAWEGWMSYWGESYYGIDTSATALDISVEDLTTSSFVYKKTFNGIFNGTVSQGTGVNLVNASFLGDGDVYRLEIQESPQSGINDNKFIVDDFSVIAVPEPATLPSALVFAGLASLSLFRRPQKLVR
jgi:hypothetical protein